jgi:hypothetical protein
MEIVRGEIGENDRLFFFRAFDYGAVFYARRRIPPLEGVGDSAPDGQRSYALLWESQWEALSAAQKGELQFLHRSEGTGPKGRDRLVLVQFRRSAGLMATGGETPAPSTSSPATQEQADSAEEEE